MIDERTRMKIQGLSPIMRAVAEALLAALDRIVDGECDEASVMQMVATMESNSKGRYNDDDLVTYDKAMKILGISDRNRLKQILSANGVEQVTIHNQKVGFPRSGVLSVKDKMRAKV